MKDMMNNMTAKGIIVRDMPHILKRVLVIRLGAFGDVVRTVPAVDALKSRYPESRITWLVDEGSAEILRGFDCIDDVIALSRKGFFTDTKRSFSALSEIRRKNFTCVFDFHGLSRSGLFSFLSHCRHRVGFARGHVREVNHLFNNIYIDPGTENISRYEKNQRLVSIFDVPMKETPPVITLKAEDIETVESFMHTLKGNGFACIHPGTSNRGRYKRWFPDRFATVADSISERYGLDIVMLYTNEEKPIVDEISSKSRTKLHLAPKLNQRQLACLLSRAKLFVGLDSGSMHVACLMATPIVALFGPSDVIHNRPWGYAPYRIVQGEVDCAPCRRRDCENRKCMEAIQLENVIEAIDEILDDAPD